MSAASVTCHQATGTAIFSCPTGLTQWRPNEPAHFLSRIPHPAGGRTLAHPLHPNQLFLLARAGVAGTLSHRPSDRVIFSTTQDQPIYDFALKDASTAYVLTGRGVHEVALSLPADGQQPQLGPTVVDLDLFGPTAATPQCCAWDPIRQILYICSSCGDVAVWSPSSDGGGTAARMFKRLSGIWPVQMAVDEVTGWLFILLSSRNDFLVLDASGDAAVLTPPGASSSSGGSATGFCIMHNAVLGGEASKGGGGWRLLPSLLALQDSDVLLLCVCNNELAFRGYPKPRFLGPLSAPGAPQLGADLSAAFSSGDLADVTLQCSDGTLVPAHRVILAARFPYFSSLFSGRWPSAGSASGEAAEEGGAHPQRSILQQAGKPSAPALEGPVGVPACTVVSADAPSPIVRSLLRWGYSGSLEVDADSAADVAALADQWCADGAKALSEEWLLENLDIGNMAVLLQLAEKGGMPALRSATLRLFGSAWGHLAKEQQIATMAALAQCPALLADVVSAVAKPPVADVTASRRIGYCTVMQHALADAWVMHHGQML